MAVFPTLDFMQIKARYPKAVEKVKEWVFSQPELKSATDGFVDPKHPEESKEQFVGLMIQMDPRKLYDIFDSLHICVSVSAHNEGGDFAYYVDTAEADGNIYYAENRHKAEVSAFNDAFEILEKSL